MEDIEDSVNKLAIKNNVTKDINVIKHKLILDDILKVDPSAYEDNDKLLKCLMKLAKKYKCLPGKTELGLLYRKLQKSEPDRYPYNPVLNHLLIKKAVRSDSGILNISVSMPPDKFSCKYNCHFCPNEPGMPRSYLSNEDVFLRAKEVDFDTVKQVYSRLTTLERNGHPIDKLEFRVLGGTFSCYSHDIADAFVRDLYYAANTYFERTDRERGTIEEEQQINVFSKAHVVGLGVETRPDEIDNAEIIRFRKYGVTRVEIGVQHTNDMLLRKLNRGHTVLASKKAIKLLKDYGFKVEIHIMADLPGSTPEMDKDCYRQVLRDDPDLIPDYMKDYPCLDVSFTKVKEWKEQGLWKPYAEDDADASKLKDVLVYRQSITPKYVRVNRIQRDFKEENELTGSYGYKSESIKSNLAQLVKDEAEKQGIYCQCIRCCEIRGDKFNPAEIQYKVVKFLASGATEYFISAEIERKNRHLLLGFLRLRISPALINDSIIPELDGPTAMIRELHVYGKIVEVGAGKSRTGAQHLGIGKKLLKMAEDIAYDDASTQIAIISGIGVRDYYRKQGYELRGSYMMKDVKTPIVRIILVICALISMVGIIIGLGITPFAIMYALMF
jgi:ELP3 family radical SAM enzyme/protein acetyltransferase